MTWNQFRDVLPIITLVLGYFGTTLTETRREHRAERQRRIDAASDFQRTTMLELQDALLDHFTCLARFVADRAWSDPAQSEPASFDAREREHVARARVSALCTRVLDDTARELVAHYTDVALGTMSASTPGVPMPPEIYAISELCMQAEERLGSVLRASDPSR